MSTPGLKVGPFTEKHFDLVNEFLLRVRRSIEGYYLGVASALTAQEGIEPSRWLFEQIVQSPDLPTCIRICRDFIQREKVKAGLS